MLLVLLGTFGLGKDILRHMLGILCSWLLASYYQPVLYGALVQCVTEQCTWLLDFCFYEWKSASCGICATMVA